MILFKSCGLALPALTVAKSFSRATMVLLSEEADAAAVTEGMLDDDMLSEVGGGFNLLDAGVKALSSRSVHRALNTKQSVFAESAEKLFDKVHPAGKKK